MTIAIISALVYVVSLILAFVVGRQVTRRNDHVVTPTVFICVIVAIIAGTTLARSI